DLLGPPALVAQLEGVAMPRRQVIAEAPQPFGIRCELRRQLHQKRAELGPKVLDPAEEDRDMDLRVQQPLHMADEAADLGGEDEAVRRLLQPALHRLLGRQAVEAGVDLDRAKAAGVLLQARLALRLARVE